MCHARLRRPLAPHLGLARSVDSWRGESRSEINSTCDFISTETSVRYRALTAGNKLRCCHNGRKQAPQLSRNQTACCAAGHRSSNMAALYFAKCKGGAVEEDKSGEKRDSPRKPCKTACTTSSSVCSFFHAVPYRMGGICTFYD